MFGLVVNLYLPVFNPPSKLVSACFSPVNSGGYFIPLAAAVEFHYYNLLYLSEKPLLLFREYYPTSNQVLTY